MTGRLPHICRLTRVEDVFGRKEAKQRSGEGGLSRGVGRGGLCRGGGGSQTVCVFGGDIFNCSS